MNDEATPTSRFLHFFRATLALVVVGSLSLAVFLAWSDQIRYPFDSTDAYSQTLYQRLVFRLLEVFLGVWAFVVGATVGSFLNVLIYRWPRGESVVLKPSHCPRCGAGIRLRDNVPILGWCRLKGLCRNCGLPISARYPSIELLTGSVFLGLYCVELISGGWNIPVRSINAYKGAVYTVLYPRWDLISYWLFHSLLFCVLITWCMTTLDRQKFATWRILILLLFVLIILGILPFLIPVAPGRWLQHSAENCTWSSAILTAAIGGMVGAGIGYLLALMTRAGASTSVLTGFLVFGMAMGWQAVLVVAFIAFALMMLMKIRPSAFQQENPAGWLACTWLAACIIHQPIWRLVYDQTFGRLV
ncbi:MAG TPA: prepilin peptidase [Pirellulaceae bacterium]|nr:prepilin peptidase [Pirellulaceae bacterium]HMO90884.1 prepilin peptidase [Pirellulaceae bacterium]HMP68640.1 prepilin peptidase [Pirellulaceae bacterium]